MATKSACPLCGMMWPDSEGLSVLGSRTYFKCARCGSFGADTNLFLEMGSFPLSVRRSLTRILSEAPRAHTRDTPLISEEEVESARKQNIRITEMADRLLTHCVRSSTSLGQYFESDNLNILRACYALTVGEVEALVDFLFNLDFADEPNDTLYFRISPSGYRHVEEGIPSAINSKQVFVAMWFDPN